MTDVLDMAVKRNMGSLLKVHIIHEGSSDDKLVLTLYGAPVADTTAKAPTKRGINWGKFHSKLDGNIRPLSIIDDKEDINAAIQILEEDIHCKKSTKNKELRR